MKEPFIVIALIVLGTGITFPIVKLIEHKVQTTIHKQAVAANCKATNGWVYVSGNMGWRQVLECEGKP